MACAWCYVLSLSQPRSWGCWSWMSISFSQIKLLVRCRTQESGSSLELLEVWSIIEEADFHSSTANRIVKQLVSEIPLFWVVFVSLYSYPFSCSNALSYHLHMWCLALPSATSPGDQRGRWLCECNRVVVSASLLQFHCLLKQLSHFICLNFSWFLEKLDLDD